MEWINTEERLPEQNEWTLCVVKDTRSNRIWDLPVLLEYHANVHRWWSADPDFVILYWMSLPDIPEELRTLKEKR